MRFNNGRVREQPDTQPKHVIEEYRHPVQRVTCVCGWEGSSAAAAGGPSPWTLHVRDAKEVRR
jgi:hypothetical protein